MDIIPAPGWETILNELAEKKGVSIFLGATDCGKSTLVRYLVERLLSAGISVSLVDADVGQSTIGLPGTISGRTFRAEEDLKDYSFERMFFVGDVNPANRIPSMTDRTKRMADIAQGEAEVTLIDTTGLISGPVGKVLKLGKVEAVKPSRVIAVQRADELEDILRAIRGTIIHRLAVAAAAVVRTASERAAYRRKKYADYFSAPGTSEFVLNEKDAKFLYRGRECGLKNALFPPGTVIGLNRGEETSALGVVEESADREVIFRCPLVSARALDSVEFGDIRIGWSSAG